MSVHEVNPGKERARRTGRLLVRSLEGHLLAQGDKLAGWALVSWDGRGSPQTSFLTNTGPIDRAMLAPYVANALTQHVASSMAQENSVEPLLDGPA